MFILLVVVCFFDFWVFFFLLFWAFTIQIKMDDSIGYYFYVPLNLTFHICFSLTSNWLSLTIDANVQSGGSQPSITQCWALALTVVWLVLSMIMALAGISLVHGSESRKGILNYRENWCLKRQQFTDVDFFFHSEIFAYSLSFISIKYGWLHFLRNTISLHRFCK